MAEVSFTSQDIPAYLRGSSFCNSLDLDQEDEISLPADCFKPDEAVNSITDLHGLLSTLRFWGVTTCPHSVFDFAFSNTEEIKLMRNTLNAFERDLPYLHYVTKLSQHQPSKRLKVAIANNNLAVVKYLLARGAKVTKACFQTACETDNLECLQLIQKFCQTNWLRTLTFQRIVARGYLRIVVFLYHSGYCIIRPYAARTACEHGSLEVMKFFNTAIETNQLCAVATRHNQLACFQYLCEHGYLAAGEVGSALGTACWCGSFDIMVYMQERGVPLLDAKLCSYAAAAPQHALEMVLYLHEHRCAWITDACTAAARAGNLDCLRYLHENGCPWDSNTLCAAGLPGSTRCLQYMMANGGGEHTQAAVQGAVEMIDWRLLRQLHKHGCELHPSLHTLAMSKGVAKRERLTAAEIWHELQAPEFQNLIPAMYDHLTCL